MNKDAVKKLLSEYRYAYEFIGGNGQTIKIGEPKLNIIIYIVIIGNKYQISFYNYENLFLESLSAIKEVEKMYTKLYEFTEELEKILVNE